MTVSVVFAIAGVIALLFGIIGGGIKAKEIEVPLLPLSARIITIIIGIVLIGITFWLEKDSKAQVATVDNPQEATLTSQTILPTPSQEATLTSQTILLTPSQEVNTDNNIIFTLGNAKSADFYSIQQATFLLQSGGNLAITGSYAQGTYLVQSLPNNFRATIQFRTEHPDDQFILGLSDGKEMRPNYHFVMTPTYTSFKQQLGFEITDSWDKTIEMTSKIPIKPDVIYVVVFERMNGGVSINLNNVFLFGLGSQDVTEISDYDHLYLTGAQQRQLIIESLVIEHIK